MCRFVLLILISCPWGCQLLPQYARADWPSFLGGSQRATVDSFSPPLQWTPTESIAWQTDLPGYGQSSPVVVNDAIYVTAIEGPQKEENLILRLNLADGTLAWRQSFPSSLQVKNDLYTSRAAPTPVADADGVIAFFESGNTVALANDGSLRWERDLIADYGRYTGRFGLGGSPAQNEDRVFVLVDDEGVGYLIALDKKTGKTLWKTDRQPRTSWSSPILMTLGGHDQIVVSSAGTVDGYDPADGTRLWSFDDVGGNTVASPLPVGGDAFLIGASPGRNGEESEGAKQSNLMMKVALKSSPSSSEPRWQPEVVWRNTEATSSFGSPIAYQGRAYYTNRAGVLYCIDLESGETLFTARLGQSNWATPIGIDDRIYIFGKSGETTVLEAAAEENVLAENQLWAAENDNGSRGFGGETLYGYAVTSQGFIVRTGSRLIAIQ